MIQQPQRRWQSEVEVIVITNLKCSHRDRKQEDKNCLSAWQFIFKSNIETT